MEVLQPFLHVYSLVACFFFTDHPDVEADSGNRQSIVQNKIVSEKISAHQRSQEWVPAQTSFKPCNETVLKKPRPVVEDDSVL